MIRLGKAFGLTSSFLAGLALALGGCGGESRLVSSETPLTPVDSLPPTNPPSPPSDTTAPPPADPPDSVPTTPPPDTTQPLPPPPVHEGIGLGPVHVPTASYSVVYTGALQNGQPDSLLAALEAARRASARVVVSFTGNAQWNRDANGFSLTKWKQRVDRFRQLDFASYVADGTFLGHLIMDEPSDRNNWNGYQVPLSDIEEMTRYSKEIWPSLPVILRAWPWYLEGAELKHLDALWIQYHVRLGDIESWISKSIRAAQARGWKVVGGLNVIDGGGKDSGMPSYDIGKYAMSPTQLRSWGGRLLSEGPCLFVFWEYRPEYFSRSDVKAAVEELSQTARALPKKACRD